MLPLAKERNLMESKSSFSTRLYLTPLHTQETSRWVPYAFHQFQGDMSPPTSLLGMKTSKIGMGKKSIMQKRHLDNPYHGKRIHKLFKIFAYNS